MKKKIFAFYDILVYIIICGPLIVASIYWWHLIAFRQSSSWLYENLHIVILFSVSITVSAISIIFFRHCDIENDFVFFTYFFHLNIKKATDNIDCKWNQMLCISEVKDVEIVKLTEEEKKVKVFYRHWFNKYLKINMKYGNPKYVYVGNYANFQIKKIIKILQSK